MERTGEARKPTIATNTPEVAGGLDEVVIDPPDRTFASGATAEVGGRAVELRYLGRGHTDHDIVISVPGTDVLFAGDLLENGAVPWYGDGYPLEWPATAAAITDLLGQGVVVPGHGDHAGRDFAISQTASIAMIADLARRVHTGDMSIEAAVAAHPFPEHPQEDARRPLERALAQLRRELSPA
jgi:glyoxylase-like metal-dependent hydrolase (beta-lactamase superfamily II)